MSPRHAKWVEFMQTFNFVAKYKTGKTNIVADALSRKHHLLSILETKILGFEMIKPLYLEDDDLKELYLECQSAPKGLFHVDHGFMFKGNRLCIPKSPIRLLLVKEVHEGSLGGHFGIQKTLDMIAQHFYWPKMLGTIEKYILKCETCVKAKLTFHRGEYKPLPVADRP